MSVLTVPAAALILLLGEAQEGAVPNSKQGLIGEYFEGTAFEKPLLQKLNANLSIAPTTGPLWVGGPAANFSVRWSGYLHIAKAGRYRFEVQADDAMKIWIDESQVVEARGGGKFELELAEGLHSFLSEFVQGPFGYAATLWWTEPGGAERVVVPAERFCVPWLPVPEKDLQAKAEKELKEVLKDDAVRKDPVARRVLASKLLKMAGGVKDAPVQRYVLLRESRDHSLATGDLPSALAAVNMMSFHFQVDPSAEKRTVLEKAKKTATTPDAINAVASGFVSVAEEALDREEHAQASGALEQAEALLRGGKDATQAGRIRERINEVGMLKREYESIRGSLEKLKAAAADPDANLEVAKYYCFAKQDWARGIPYLGKARGTKLDKVGELEVAPPAAAKELGELAQAWVDVANSLKGNEKRAAQDRAAHWYRTAIRKANELERALLEGGLAKLWGPSVFPQQGLAFWVEPGKGPKPWTDLTGKNDPAVNQKAIAGGNPSPPKMELTELWYPPSKQVKAVTGAGTVAVWARPAAFTGLQSLVERGPGFNQDFNLHLHRDGRVWFGPKTLPDGSGVASDPVVKESAWYFMAATWNDRQISVYVDGLRHATAPLKGSLSMSQDAMRIGKSTFDDAYFRGELGLVTLHNRVLSDPEIWGLYDLYRKKLK
jgi:hypothetical protein